MTRLPPRTAAVATAALALLALIGIALGTGRVLGPALTTSDHDLTFEPRTVEATGSPPPTSSQTPPFDLPTPSSAGSFGTVLLILLVLAAVAAVLLIAWILWRAHRLRPERRREAEEELEDQELLEVEDAHRALERAEQSLDYAAAPRDAVIEAWLALETGIAEAGIRRRPAQTTTEYVVSVLGDLDLPADDLQTLADLYGRALFDDRGIPESSRVRARTALRRLRERLASQEAAR